MYKNIAVAELLIELYVNMVQSLAKMYNKGWDKNKCMIQTESSISFKGCTHRAMILCDEAVDSHQKE